MKRILDLCMACKYLELSPVVFRKLYSKACVKRPLKKKDKTKILMTNGSLIKVKSIAECNTFDRH